MPWGKIQHGFDPDLPALIPFAEAVRPAVAHGVMHILDAARPDFGELSRTADEHCFYLDTQYEPFCGLISVDRLGVIP